MCDATNVLQGPLSSFKKKLKLKKFEKKNVSLTMEIIKEKKEMLGFWPFCIVIIKVSHRLPQTMNGWVKCAPDTGVWI